MTTDRIIKDSSIWRSSNDHARVAIKDCAVRIGIVRSAGYNVKEREIIYTVEVQDSTDRLFIPCTALRKFGGLFNYEDQTYRTYNPSRSEDVNFTFAAKAGDTVLVAYLNGDSREGVILGGINHGARDAKLRPEDGPQFLSEFNGIEKNINKDGELTVTFRGQPTNLDILSKVPVGAKLPAPTYNIPKVGGTFYKFDKTGSWEMNDIDPKGQQFIRVDKPMGIITVTSGKVVLKLEKGPEKTSLTTKHTIVTSTETITETTKKWDITASTFTKIRSPKVAIGTDSIELLKKIVDFIDALGHQTPISPVGPCSKLSTDPQWQEIASIQRDINTIRGTL